MPAKGELTFDRALAELASALTFGIHPSLDSIAAMMTALQRPQDTFKSVQVTGTNGKSSVTRMTAAILRAHGVKTGCYTSPHLDTYTERIEVDGHRVSESHFARAIGAALDAAKRAEVAAPTEFELLTAAALWHFAQAGVETAVLEVGMGGRWDATSVVKPSVAVITGVGLDHTDHLGATRELIAADKAHIIKQGSVALLGPGTEGVDDVLLARAVRCGVECRAVRPHSRPSPVPEALTVRYGIEARPHGPDESTTVSVRGVHADYGHISIAAPAYQSPNMATAIAAAEGLLGGRLDVAALRAAFAGIKIPGRFEVVAREPILVLDAAHNPQAGRVLASAIEDAWPDAGSRPVIVVGVLADKDARGIVEALSGVASGFACVTPDSPRALPARDLAGIVRAVSSADPDVYDSVAEALEAQRDVSGRPVVVTGSHVTIAQVRQTYRR